MRENPVLRAKNIRVLPVARQTKRVNGTAEASARFREHCHIGRTLE
jgi:hypothetical protein